MGSFTYRGRVRGRFWVRAGVSVGKEGNICKELLRGGRGVWGTKTKGARHCATTLKE